MSLIINNKINDKTKAVMLNPDKMKLKAISYTDEEIKRTPEVKISGGNLIKNLDNIEDFVASGKKIISEKNEELFYCPDQEKREAILIAGKSGCGKSTWIRNYIIMYNLLFPDNEVYLISDKDESKAYQKFDKPIDGMLQGEPRFDQIEPTLELLEGLNIDLFDNCLIILDDCIFADSAVTTEDKQKKKLINRFMENVLKLGREANINIIVAKHILNDGQITRILKAECDNVIFFPKYSARHHIVNYLKGNGLGKKEINYIMKSPGRWVLCSINFPTIILNKDTMTLL